MSVVLRPDMTASDIIAAIHVLNETIKENNALHDSEYSKGVYNTDAVIRKCNDNILILQEKLFFTK